MTPRNDCYTKACTRAAQELLGYINDGYQVRTQFASDREQFSIVTARHRTNGNRLTIRVCVDAYQVLVNNHLKKLEVCR